MAETTEPPSAGEVRELTAWLRSISGRMTRGEHVPREELDAYHAAKDDMLARIDGGAR